MATSDDSGLYIGTSTTTDPEDTDAPSKGAAEIRQVKIQAKNTFPNCTGAVTSSHTELNYLDGSTPGTAVASKALVVDANNDINLGTGDLTATLLTGAHNGTVGATTPAAGTFTTLTANTSLTVNGTTTITGVIDDDTMATAAATNVPTTESVVAYLAAQLAALPFSESYTSSEITLSSAALSTLAHGLSSAPTLIQARMICKVAEYGYSINDEVIYPPGNRYVSSGLSITVDATNVKVRQGTTHVINHKTTGVGVELTNSSWRLVIRAWA